MNSPFPLSFFILWISATAGAFSAQMAAVQLVSALTSGSPDSGGIAAEVGHILLGGLLLASAQSLCLRGADLKIPPKLWFWATSVGWFAGSLLQAFLPRTLAALSENPSFYLGTGSQFLFLALLGLKWLALAAAQGWVFRRISMARRRQTWLILTPMGGLLGYAAFSGWQVIEFQRFIASGSGNPDGFIRLLIAGVALQGLPVGWLTALALIGRSLRDILRDPKPPTPTLFALVTVFSCLTINVPSSGTPYQMTAWYSQESCGRVVAFAVSAVTLLASTWGAPRIWNLASRTAGIMGLAAVAVSLFVEFDSVSWFGAVHFILSAFLLTAATLIAWWPSHPNSLSATARP